MSNDNQQDGGTRSTLLDFLYPHSEEINVFGISHMISIMNDGDKLRCYAARIIMLETPGESGYATTSWSPTADAQGCEVCENAQLRYVLGHLSLSVKCYHVIQLHLTTVGVVIAICIVKFGIN